MAYRVTLTQFAVYLLNAPNISPNGRLIFRTQVQRKETSDVLSCLDCHFQLTGPNQPGIGDSKLHWI